MIDIINLFNPSTITGSLLIGIVSGLISGLIIGFFSGKKYANIKLTTNGNSSPIINNSEIKVTQDGK